MPGRELLERLVTHLVFSPPIKPPRLTLPRDKPTPPSYRTGANQPTNHDTRAPHIVRGAHAEDIAAAYLERKGFTILARNIRVGRAEIDLLVREGVVIVVVEVRTRGPRSYQRALDSIDTKKRARLRKAGERLWRERYARDMRVERMRFDVIAVDLEVERAPSVEHIKAAF